MFLEKKKSIVGSWNNVFVVVTPSGRKTKPRAYLLGDRAVLPRFFRIYSSIETHVAATSYPSVTSSRSVERTRRQCEKVRTRRIITGRFRTSVQVVRPSLEKNRFSRKTVLIRFRPDGHNRVVNRDVRRSRTRPATTYNGYVTITRRTATRSSVCRTIISNAREYRTRAVK